MKLGKTLLSIVAAGLVGTGCATWTEQEAIAYARKHKTLRACWTAVQKSDPTALGLCGLAAKKYESMCKIAGVKCKNRRLYPKKFIGEEKEHSVVYTKLPDGKYFAADIEGFTIVNSEKQIANWASHNLGHTLYFDMPMEYYSGMEPTQEEKNSMSNFLFSSNFNNVVNSWIDKPSKPKIRIPKIPLYDEDPSREF